MTIIFARFILSTTSFVLTASYNCEFNCDVISVVPVGEYSKFIDLLNELKLFNRTFWDWHGSEWEDIRKLAAKPIDLSHYSRLMKFYHDVIGALRALKVNGTHIEKGLCFCDVSKKRYILIIK